ncbi:MAG: hypothetical protein WCC66_08665 [Rhizobiaceae bacterium]
MKNFVKFAVVSAMLAAPLPAVAATGNVQFDATVNNTCAITVQTAGLLTANVGQTVLSSTNAGGSAGTAEIVATSANYTVSVDQPTAFSAAPVGGGTNVNFAATYASAGATTLTARNTAAPLLTGTSNVTVNMSATKTSGSFPTGTYAGIVVLRCE